MRNSRFTSQVIIFFLLYLLFCYFLYPYYLSLILLHIPLYYLLIAVSNTLSIDPGLVSQQWSKRIESRLSKEISNELEYLTSQRKALNNSTISLINSSISNEKTNKISNIIEPETTDEELYMQAFDIVMQEKRKYYRFCNKCESFKTKLTFHCKVCGRCVLGLDHHNYILDKCIGIDNKKCYFLGIFYATLCYFLMFFGFWRRIPDISDENLLEFAMFYLALCFSLGLFAIYSIILAFHAALQLGGVTLREYYKGKKLRIAKVRRILRNRDVLQWFSPFNSRKKQSEVLYEQFCRGK